MNETPIRARVFCARVFAVACTIALAGGIAMSSGDAAAAEQLTYRVTHSTFGDIGTYTNTIIPTAGGTTVQSQAHLNVKVLGVNLYREDAQRTELWQNNRLVAFNGVTSKGSDRTVLSGAARGNSFVINTPHGTVTAPASVHPANPWSANFLNSNTMMRLDDGRLEAVRISGGEPAVVDINGRQIQTRKYEVVGTTHYDVWLDSQGVPVQFVADENGSRVTFTLASCTRCGNVMAERVGMR
jgi:hypothetical protein